MPFSWSLRTAILNHGATAHWCAVDVVQVCHGNLGRLFVSSGTGICEPSAGSLVCLEDCKKPMVCLNNFSVSVPRNKKKRLKMAALEEGKV